MAEEAKGHGKLAVVTGASTGIGFELSKQLARHGFDLIIVAHEAQIHDSARTLQGYGINVKPVQVNLAKTEGTDRLWQEIQAINRPVEVLVLNAGVGVSGDFVRDNSMQEEMDLIGLNITSPVRLAKYVLPSMLERGSGRVLITSSIAALMPGPFFATYAASKSFLLSFSEALYNELEDSGVTVTALMPGATDTEFFRRAGMEDTKVGQAEKDDPALVAKQAFEAMMNGDDHVVAGSASNKINAFASKFMSEQQRARMQRKETEPNSAHK